MAGTKLGQKSLEQPIDISIFHQKPDLRVYIGLALFILSFITSVPGIALLSFLSIKLEQPLIVAIGTPVVIIVAHIMFALGIFLAGKNYAKDMLYWSVKQFIEKYGS